MKRTLVLVVFLVAAFSASADCKRCKSGACETTTFGSCGCDDSGSCMACGACAAGQCLFPCTPPQSEARATFLANHAWLRDTSMAGEIAKVSSPLAELVRAEQYAQLKRTCTSALRSGSFTADNFLSKAGPFVEWEMVEGDGFTLYTITEQPTSGPTKLMIDHKRGKWYILDSELNAQGTIK